MQATPSDFQFRPILETLLERRDLTESQAAAVMAAIVQGQLAPAEIAAFAVALRMKGESVNELAGLAAAMRDHSLKITAPPGAIDTCGTGGDASGTFNISTAAALVVAGMGIPVAKHGGKASSSLSGSADVLHALGVNIDLDPSGVQRCLDAAGIAFLFAPTFHPGMKHAAPVRKTLGVRTVFNLLGPLSNPAGAKFQLLGVSRPEHCELFAKVLQKLGSLSAMIVCGAGPNSGTGGSGYLDEVSTFGPTTVARLKDGAIKVVQLDAQKLGFPLSDPAALQVHSAQQSAAVIRDLLAAKKSPARDIVLVNAAAAAQIAGLARTWIDGLALAAQAIDSGAAAAVLTKLIHASNK